MRRKDFGVGVLNGKIYAVGGWYINNADGTKNLNSVEEYDPLTNRWVYRKSLSNPRRGLSVGVANGKLYAINGSIVEEYSPVADTWVVKAPMPTPRSWLAIGVVNNKIYAIGGSSTNVVEEYDPLIDRWVTKASMGEPRHGLVVSVINNKIYAIGGTTEVVGVFGGDATNIVEEYNPLTNSWKQKASFPSGTCEYTGCAAVYGKIYVMDNPVREFTPYE
jgi:N-acetylneuraminic acid mutarotase